VVHKNVHVSRYVADHGAAPAGAFTDPALSDAERALSPVVIAVLTPGLAIMSAGYVSSDLAALGLGLGLLGHLILSPELFRRAVFAHIDGRLSARRRLLNRAVRLRQRHRRLEHRLPRLASIMLVSVCVAVPAWTALMVVRPVHLAITTRAAIATLVAVIVLVATAATACLATAWIQVQTFRRVRHLHVDPTITASEVADRLEQGCAPVVGWIALSLGAACVALAPYIHVKVGPFGH
jgi:hypothetical protein